MSDLLIRTINNVKTSNFDTSRNVKPAKPKGYLVDTPIYKAPVEYFEDLAKDSYSIVKGVKGKANDHELGKQNDVGMKLGILAIAAYLTSFRTLRTEKISELIGAGSFMATMAMWPKLAIALPLKLRTGIDVNQKYVDSEGRKKRFFQDSQYLPWDLYTKGQIGKIGDKMGVPYDVPNRDEVIQEKARKMATQANTLNLLTAGFATPIVTSLIANGLTPVVEEAKQKYLLNKTQSQMDKINLSTSGKPPKEVSANFESYLTTHMGKKMVNSSELLDFFTWSDSSKENLISDYLKKDFDKIFNDVNNDIKPQIVDDLYEKFKEHFVSVGVSRDEISEAFKKNELFGSYEGMLDRFKKVNPGKDTLAWENHHVTCSVIHDLIDSKRDIAPEVKNLAKNNITEKNIRVTVLEPYNTKILDEKTANLLRNVHSELSTFYRREDQLKRWSDARFGKKSADNINILTNQKLKNKIFTLLEFTPEEIKTLSDKVPRCNDIIEKRFAEIAADSKKYKKVVSSIASIIADYDSMANESMRMQYGRYVDDICNSAKFSLKNLGFDSVAEYIGDRTASISEKGTYETLSGTLKNLKKVECAESIYSQKAMLYRFIQLLDLHRRAIDGSFDGAYNVLTENKKIKVTSEKLLTMAKSLIMKGTKSDHCQKMNIKTGSERVYESLIRILYGALPEDFTKNSMIKHFEDVAERQPILSKYNNGESVNSIYKEALKTGFDRAKLNEARMTMSTDTLDALYSVGDKKNIDIVENMKAFYQTFIERVVNFEGERTGFTLAEKHNLEGAIDNLHPIKVMDKSFVGQSPKDFLQRNAESFLGNKKWLKTFGVAGGVLLVGTVLATLFFGHLPQKEMYMKNGNK